MHTKSELPHFFAENQLATLDEMEPPDSSAESIREPRISSLSPYNGPFPAGRRIKAAAPCGSHARKFSLPARLHAASDVDLLDVMVQKERFSKLGSRVSALFGQKRSDVALQTHGNALFDAPTAEESFTDLPGSAFASGLARSDPPRNQTRIAEAQDTCVPKRREVSDSATSFNKLAFSPPGSLSKLNNGTTEMALCEMGNMEREDFFDDSQLNVATHTARCAFMHTLQSPFEAPSKSGYYQTTEERIVNTKRAYRRGHERRMEAETRLYRMQQFLKTPHRARVSDLCVAEEEEEEEEDVFTAPKPKKKKRRSPSLLPKFKSLFMCFTGQESKAAAQVAPKPPPPTRHRSTESSVAHLTLWKCEKGAVLGLAMLPSRGSAIPADSSAHRYHRRHDFMRSMLESQLDSGC